MFGMFDSEAWKLCQGCYCTENELKAILQDLKEKQEWVCKNDV